MTGVPRGTWTLRHGDEVAARLPVTEAEFPWLHARLVEGPAFGAVAGLLAEELRLVEQDDDQEAWTTVYERLRAATSLEDPDGRAVAEYILHVDRAAGTAWWRWLDDPTP